MVSLFCLICSCSSSSSWQINTITAGDIAYDASRIRFISSQAHPPFIFEIIEFANEPRAFISLTRFRFTENPVGVTLIIEGNSFEERAPVYEGAMRIKLSVEMTQRLVQALQDGHEVAILVDGFEERLDPSQFPLRI